jgi:hypothetical protein
MFWILPSPGPWTSVTASWATRIRALTTMSVQCVEAREYWLFDYFLPLKGGEKMRVKKEVLKNVDSK